MSRKGIAVVAACLIACSAMAFLAGRAAGQEQAVPTMTEILQQRVSVSVQDAATLQLWDAVSRVCAEAAHKAGADSLTLAPGVAPEYVGAISKDWRVSLSLTNIRVGDLLRVTAALYGCDVYVKGQREIAMAAPETREMKGVQSIPPLTANDY